MYITTEYTQKLTYEDLIRENQLHNTDSEIGSGLLRMIDHNNWLSGRARLSWVDVAYLWDYGELVGLGYIEHLPEFEWASQPALMVFGVFVHPFYRGFGYATALSMVLREKIYGTAKWGLPIRVSKRAYSIFKKVFGNDYPIESISWRRAIGD